MKKIAPLFLALCCALTAHSQSKVLTYTHGVYDESVIEVISSVDHPDCLGPGSINLSVYGGLGSYTFLWDGPSGFSATTQDISGLTNPGIYNVFIDDGNGCPVSEQFTLTYSCPYTCSGIQVDVVNHTDLANCAVEDGTIDFQITGGSGNYEYTLTRDFGSTSTIATGSNNGSVLSFTNLGQGAYTLDVHDIDNDCYVSGSQNLTSPFYLYDGTYYSSSNSDCTNPDGALSPTVIGATLPENLSYDWVGPNSFTASTLSISNLFGGDYYFAVVDNNTGCHLYAYGSVSNASFLDVTVDKTNSTRCDAPNGAIDITINAIGPFDTEWTRFSDPAFSVFTEDISSLEPDTYTLVAYDLNSGCTATVDVVITNAAAKPTITANTVPNTRCSTPFNGGVNTTVSGTPGPFTYEWRNISGTIVSTAPSPANLAPGPIGYVITDASTGCTYYKNAGDGLYIIDQSLPTVSIPADVTNNTNCSAPYNGAIDLTVNTTASYTVEWEGPMGFEATTEDITGLRPGDYTYTVTVQCASNVPPVIDPPDDLQVLSGNSILSFNVLPYITDADNNLVPSTIEIVEQPESGAVATIEQVLSDFVLKLDYQSVNFEGTDRLRIGACDALGACTEADIMVDVKTNMNILIYNAVSPNGDDANAFMRITGLPQQSTNKITIYNRWGDEVFYVEGYDNLVASKRFEGVSKDGKDLPTGNYFYKLEIEGRKTMTGYISLKR